MMRGLTKKNLAAGAVIAASLFAAATPSASADTSTLRLGCYVDSPALDKVRPDLCAVRQPASKYNVYFDVLGRSATTGYTYKWATNGLTIGSAGGCTSSSHHCSIRVQRRGDWSLTMSVVVTELATGASKKVTARAEGFAVCGQFFC